jgi:hypothetical protein
LSWYRNVSHRCRSVLVPICPRAEVSRIRWKYPPSFRWIFNHLLRMQK